MSEGCLAYDVKRRYPPDLEEVSESTCESERMTVKALNQKVVTLTSQK